MQPSITPIDDDEHARAFLELAHRLEPLKHLPRTGWVDRDIVAPESVAAHSWRLAVLTWLEATARGLDVGRAIQLALAHDLAEIITGDSTPFDALVDTPAERRDISVDPPDPATWRNHNDRQQKSQREREAMAVLLADLPAATATVLAAAWEEYEQGETDEARLVHQIDKVEAFAQGAEYVRSGRLKRVETLNSFRIDTDRQVQDPMLRAALHCIAAELPGVEESDARQP